MLMLQDFGGDRRYEVSLWDSSEDLAAAAATRATGNPYACFVCVLEVPAYMIPRDILSYFGSSLDDMKAFKVYQQQQHQEQGDMGGGGVDEEEKYAAVIEMTNEAAVSAFIRDYSGQQLSTLEGILCIVSRVDRIGIVHSNNNSDSVNDDGGKKNRSTTDDDEEAIATTGGKEKNTTAVGGGGGPLQQLPPFLQAWADAALSETCPLCLEPILHSLSQSQPTSSAPSPVPFLPQQQQPGESSGGGGGGGGGGDTTASNNSNSGSRSNNLSPLGDNLSPLGAAAYARQQQTSPSSSSSSSSSGSAAAHGYFSTACKHDFHINCIRKLQEPQCPVCRFQHDSDCSMASACSTCGWKGLPPPQSSINRREATTTEAAAAAAAAGGGRGEGEREGGDLWMCMVCGFIGCGRGHAFHIRDHYHDTLHAYVLNMETKRVWDFAGGGYVHRLAMTSGTGGAGGAGTDDNGGDSSSNSDEEAGWLPAAKANSGSNRSSQMMAGAAVTGGSERPRLTMHRPVPTAAGESPLSLSLSAAGAGAGASTKVVEIAHPYFRGSNERPSSPRSFYGLSSSEEEALIHSRLEEVAETYQDSLLGLMRRRRRSFDEQVRGIHQFSRAATLPTAGAGGDAPGSGSGAGKAGSSSGSGNSNSNSNSKAAAAGTTRGSSSSKSSSKSSSSKSSSSSGGGGSNKRSSWSRSLLTTLLAEKRKEQTRIARAKERLQETETELDTLNRIHDMLDENEALWKEKVRSQQAALDALCVSKASARAALEQEVEALMQRMGSMEAAESDAPTTDALQEEVDRAQSQRRRGSSSGGVSSSSSSSSSRSGGGGEIPSSSSTH